MSDPAWGFIDPETGDFIGVTEEGMRQRFSSSQPVPSRDADAASEASARHRSRHPRGRDLAAAALALSEVAHDLVPGIRHDFGLVAEDALQKAGWLLVRASGSPTDAALELPHTQEADGNGVWCREDGQRWPCDTVSRARNLARATDDEPHLDHPGPHPHGRYCAGRHPEPERAASVIAEVTATYVRSWAETTRGRAIIESGDMPTTDEGRDLLAHVVQYDPEDAEAAVVAAKIVAVERAASASPIDAALPAYEEQECGYECPYTEDGHDAMNVGHVFIPAAIRASGSPTDAARKALAKAIDGNTDVTLGILDVIDGIVDDTHPEGDGCPLCRALDDLRAALAPSEPTDE